MTKDPYEQYKEEKSIEIWKDLYYNSRKEIEQLKMKINSLELEIQKVYNGRDDLDFVKPKIEIKSADNQKTINLQKTSTRKKVKAYDLDGNFLEEFDSATKASIKCGVSLAAVSTCCNRKKDRVHNLIFRFSDDEDPVLPFVKKEKPKEIKPRAKRDVYVSMRPAKELTKEEKLEAINKALAKCKAS